MIDVLATHIVNLVRKHDGLSVSIRSLTLRKFVLVAFATLTTCTGLGASTVQAKDGSVIGKMVYTVDKHQLGAVYNVKKDGSTEVIVDTQVVTLPAASVESRDGKLWTTLTRKEALRAH